MSFYHCCNFYQNIIADNFFVIISLLKTLCYDIIAGNFVIIKPLLHFYGIMSLMTTTYYDIIVGNLYHNIIAGNLYHDIITCTSNSNENIITGSLYHNFIANNFIHNIIAVNFML